MPYGRGRGRFCRRGRVIPHCNTTLTISPRPGRRKVAPDAAAGMTWKGGGATIPLPLAPAKAGASTTGARFAASGR